MKVLRFIHRAQCFSEPKVLTFRDIVQENIIPTPISVDRYVVDPDLYPGVSKSFHNIIAGTSLFLNALVAQTLLVVGFQLRIDLSALGGSVAVHLGLQGKETRISQGAFHVFV